MNLSGKDPTGPRPPREERPPPPVTPSAPGVLPPPVSPAPSVFHKATTMDGAGTGVPSPDEAAAARPGVELHNDYDRYRDLEELGQGGVGTVLSGLDPHLGRAVAIKVLKESAGGNSRERRTRFVREARVMAQLEHPNIMPVHELGTRADGRVYFTMKRVDGESLDEILMRLGTEEPEAVRTYTLDRLLDIFSHVCQAVAFAHCRGVLHRDLKPGNILVGRFAEVLVVDWGLAKLLIGEEANADPAANLDLETSLDLQHKTTTIEGRIAGTPVYMAPEQARGCISELDERTDLYSLGVILYELLTLRRPVDGGTLPEILQNVQEALVIPPRRRMPGRKIPRELDAICMKALAKRPDDRYRDVMDLIVDLERWQAGRPVLACPDPWLRRFWKWCLRHPVKSSTSAVAALSLLLAASGVFLVRSVRYHDSIHGGDVQMEEARKAASQAGKLVREWRELRDANHSQSPSLRETKIQAKVTEWEGRMEGAMTLASVLYAPAGAGREDVRGRWEDLVRLRLGYLESRRDYHEMAKQMNEMRELFGPGYGRASPELRTELRRWQDVAAGVGSLRVAARPAGARIDLWTFTPDAAGLLRPANRRPLGQAPVTLATLPKGSYLLVANWPEFSGLADPAADPGAATGTLSPEPPAGVVYLPVKVDHAEKQDLEVFWPGRIPDGTVYVPAGTAEIGGWASRQDRQHEVWIDGFFIGRTEVSVREYLAFWLDPAGGARRDRLRSHLRLNPEEYEFLDAWDDAGNLRPELSLDRPVVGISQAAAAAYCHWLGRKSGRACRLPTAGEWEKAARGADGRDYVWGGEYRPGLAYSTEEKEARARFGIWAPPGSFPTDVSVYGAADLAGNVREWTGSSFPETATFQIKGGSSCVSRRFLCCAYASDTPVVPSDVGFRYVIPLDGKPPVP